MAFDRRSLVTVALAGVIGVGLVGAYRTTALSGEKCGSGTAKQTSGSGSACCKMKGTSQASATAGEATVIPVGSGSACTKSAGAMQTSEKTGASCGGAMQSAEKAGCGAGAGATHAGMAGCSFQGADDCGGCELYKTYWTSIEKAHFEMNPRPDGIVVTYASNDPAVLADLVKFANAKAEFYKKLAATKDIEKHCTYCQEKAGLMKNATMKVEQAGKTVSTTITSKDPVTVGNLHKLAAADTHADEHAVLGG